MFFFTEATAYVAFSFKAELIFAALTKRLWVVFFCNFANFVFSSQYLSRQQVSCEGKERGLLVLDVFGFRIFATFFGAVQIPELPLWKSEERIFVDGAMDLVHFINSYQFHFEH